MNIEVRIDKQRGCGRRKPGGLYLVSGEGFANCGKLPIPLSVCPTCHCGIKPSRGWTWIGKELVINETCHFPAHKCKDCAPFDGSVDLMGLLWVGQKFYKTPGDFMKEAIEQGISRRIAHIPTDFKIGETWVLLAHQNQEILMEDLDPMEKGAKPKPVKITDPQVFMAFRPERIEYVVKIDDPPEKLERLEKQGITLVRVVADGEIDFEASMAEEADTESMDD